MIYLDDRLPTHPKILRAGALLGNRTGDAFLLYVVGISYARNQLTNGFLPDTFVTSCGLVATPQAVANALSNRGVRLWRKVRGGYQIHDYLDFNPKASEVKRKRAQDRKRKALERAASNGRNAAHNLSTTDISRTRARAVPRTHVSTNPHGRGGTSNQLQVETPVLIRTTSKNLPPRSARRDSLLEKCHAETDRVSAVVHGRTRDPDSGSPPRRHRVARAHQGPDHRARLHVPAAVVAAHRCDDPGRAGARAAVGTATTAVAAGAAAARPRSRIALAHSTTAHRPGRVDGAGAHSSNTGRARARGRRRDAESRGLACGATRDSSRPGARARGSGASRAGTVDRTPTAASGRHRGAAGLAKAA